MAGPAPLRVTVGRIAGVFGVKGWVRVFSYTDPPENVLAYGPWIVGAGTGVAYEVTDGGAHGKGVVAHLRGVDDRDVARQLIGQPISVPRERFAEPAPDQYYWSDLLGLQVIDQDGKVLGRVKELFETGANDVMVLEGERRRLVPFVLGPVVKSVDLGAGVISVEWDADF